MVFENFLFEGTGLICGIHLTVLHQKLRTLILSSLIKAISLSRGTNTERDGGGLGEGGALFCCLSLMMFLVM